MTRAYKYSNEERQYNVDYDKPAIITIEGADYTAPFDLDTSYKTFVFTGTFTANSYFNFDEIEIGDEVTFAFDNVQTLFLQLVGNNRQYEYSCETASMPHIDVVGPAGYGSVRVKKVTSGVIAIVSQREMESAAPKVQLQND